MFIKLKKKEGVPMAKTYNPPEVNTVGGKNNEITPYSVAVVVWPAVWDAAAVWNYGIGVNVGAAVNFAVYNEVAWVDGN